jgi:hypothetical protein
MTFESRPMRKKRLSERPEGAGERTGIDVAIASGEDFDLPKPTGGLVALRFVLDTIGSQFPGSSR